jgi:hypothetical protein
MNVENVAWVAERKSLLCMFFSLATVAFYARYVRAPHWTRYLAVVAAFAAALMSKPMAVTLPVLLLLLDYWPLRRLNLDGSEGAKPHTLILEKAPLFLMSAASSIITIVVQHRGHAVSDLQHLPLSERLANAAVSTLTYVRRTFWPSDLSYFYPHPGANLPTATLVTAVFILVVISALVYRFREHRYLVVGWGIFLIALLPVIGILQVGMQAMADRYAYLPTIGIFIAIVWLVGDFIAARRFALTVPAALAIATLATFSAVTIATEHYWYDNLTLFTRAEQAARAPNSYIETNLAAALLDHHREAEALQHFRVAEQLAPGEFVPHYNVGHLLASQQDFAGAAAEYQQALACAKQPESRARVLNSLGVTYMNLGDHRQASDAFQQLLAIQPDNAKARAFLDMLQKDAAPRN